MHTRGTTIIRQLLQSRRGFVFIFFAMSLLVLVSLAGLAIDTARGVVAKAEVSRVVDATALAEAKTVRAGLDKAEEVARAIAALNGIEPDETETLTLPTPVTNADGEVLIEVSATRQISTTFMRVLGETQMTVQSTAEATVPPVDIVLVIDQSQSMLNKVSGSTTPWSKLRPAAKLFISQFSDQIDQIGLVHFSTMAELAMELQEKFTSKAKSRIDKMKPSGDTNGEEALSFAWGELASDRAREKALKVIVFFTDGRPTAFRDSGGDMGNKDGILTAVPTLKGGGKGILNWYTGPQYPPPGIRPDDPWIAIGDPDCHDVVVCNIPGGQSWTRDEVLERARDLLIANAEGARLNGIFIYSIGLGNLSGNPEEQPDHDLLKLIANVDGSQMGTQGGYFFASTPDDLERVFQAVAADILARLSQ
jgi:Flp pilus assembly protein TadG